MSPSAVEECLEMLQAKAEMKHHKFDLSRNLYASILRQWPSDDIGLHVVAMAVFKNEEYPDVAALEQMHRVEIATRADDRYDKEKSQYQKPGRRGIGGFDSILKITGSEMWAGVRKGILEHYTTTGTKPSEGMKQFVRRKDKQWLVSSEE